MNFINPTLAAAGLLCVMIPIIIHILMRRRRRPVQWAAMRFIVEAYRRQRRRMSLEQLLLLLARCALVALLGLAIGKPVLGSATFFANHGPRTLYLVVDNSLASSVAVDRSPQTEFESWRDRALAMIDALDQSRGDRVAVIAAATPSEGLVLPPTPELNAARQVLRELVPSHARADWPGSLAIVKEQLTSGRSDSGQTLVSLVSPWRAGSVDLESSLSALTADDGKGVSLFLTPPASVPESNVTIASVEPARRVIMAAGSSGGNAESGGTPVRVKLTRSGAGLNASATTSVSVRMVSADASAAAKEASTQATAIVAWAARQDSAEAFMTLPAPKAERTSTSDRPPVFIVASIDSDVLTADNQSAVAVQVRDRLDVGIIAPPSAVGQAADSFNLAAYSPADWYALSLSPRGDLSLRQRQSGEIRVQLIDPQQGIAPSVTAGGSGRGAGLLTGMDAVLVARPDLLDTAGWKAVREVFDAGACVILCPSPIGKSQLWSDEMKTALGVDWVISRDPTELTPPSNVSIGTAKNGATASNPRRRGDLLALINAELPELVKPVGVSRVLDVRPAGDGFDTMLSLSTGQPLLVSLADAAASQGADAIKTQRRGTLVMFTAAIDVDWTDLPARPLMVPLMQELVRQGIGRGASLRSVAAGSAVDGLGSAAADMVRASGVFGDEASGTADRIGLDQRGRTQSPLRTRGAWLVRGSTGGVMGAVAVSADPDAASVAMHTKDEIAKWLAPISQRVTWIDEKGPAMPVSPGATPVEETAPMTFSKAIGDSTELPPISFPLLVAAGCIALLELACARWFSHAKQENFTFAAAEKQGGASASRGAAAA